MLPDVIVIDGREFDLPPGLPMRERDTLRPRRHHPAYTAAALDAVATGLCPGWQTYTVYTYTPLCGAVK